MIRLAVRGIVMRGDRLLLVNAYGDGRFGLMCCPGGGVEKHASLPDNLIREIHEETGIAVAVERPVLVNEFHEPEAGFHQVEVFFRCHILAMPKGTDWHDPERVVTERRWVTREEFRDCRVKPSSLEEVVWGDGGPGYDTLELIVR